MNPPGTWKQALPACRWGLLVLLLAVAGSTSASAREPDWSAYAALLGAHVRPVTRHGVTLHGVDYPALARDPRLASALAAVENFPLAALASPGERLAFLINAYNLLALKLVADHWPIDSIRDIGSLFRPVWKRPAGRLDGHEVSLDEIEHGRLRKLGEPRIHFAIVCASISCPDLRNEPYRAATLDAQLDDQVTGFLHNAGKGLRLNNDVAHVSRIFDWFAEDFAAAGGVVAFVRRHRANFAVTRLAADLPYDWRVNALP